MKPWPPQLVRRNPAMTETAHVGESPRSEPKTSNRSKLVATLVLCALVGGLAGWHAKPGADVVAGFEAPGLPALEASAMASQAQDNFVLATGFVDDAIEAVFFLDFLTGELRGGVVNERGPGFIALFEYNISADFNAAGIKNPKFLMVPGVARNLRQTSNRMGHCLLYVVEATSGQLRAYAVPFNPALYAAGKPQKGAFIPIASAQLRQQYVRDQ